MKLSNSILKKWISINPTDYLLFDTKFHQLTSPQFTHKLNAIFGKGIGSSQMRKTYLSDKFGSIHDMDANMKKIQEPNIVSKVFDDFKNNINKTILNYERI